MAKIALNTRMDTFLMPDSILALSEESITIEKTFTGALPWICLETIAQSASFHVKWRKQFNRHSFLLKVDFFSVKTDLPDNLINDKLILKGQLDATSASASSYTFKTDETSPVDIIGSVVIGEIDFNEQFKKTDIQFHSRTRFQCLINE